MANNIEVGKEIFTILSEALYSNPYHVFREYVQNSIDSLRIKSNKYSGKIDIHLLDGMMKTASKVNAAEEQHLVISDNGVGYRDNIEKLVTTLADSTKDIRLNIGYKGIGRLAGYSYCDSVTYISITDKRECLTLDVKGIKESISKMEDFDISDYYEMVNEEDLEKYLHEEGLYEYLHETGFVVMLKNINQDIKRIISYMDFKDNMATRIKCRYDIKEVISKNSNIIDFIHKFNTSINYSLNFNGVEILKRYKADKNDLEYIVDIKGKETAKEFFIDREDTSDLETEQSETKDESNDYIVGKVIYKIGKKVGVRYRGDKDQGIKVYQKGMLVASDLDVVEKVLSYFNVIGGSPSDYYQGMKSIYVEIHVESDDVLLNSARTWFSYIVPNRFNPKYTFIFMEYLNELIQNANELRYDYSKFARKSTTDKDKYKAKFMESLEFFVDDFEIESEKLEKYFIDPNKNEVEEEDRVERIKNSRKFLLPKKSGYNAKEKLKLNQIIQELITLDISSYRNASAILFRTFLELSLKYAIQIKDGYKYDNKHFNLYEALKSYNDYMWEKNKKENSGKANMIHSEIIQLLDDQESVRIFNGCVHSLDLLVKEIVLLNIRDGLIPILDDIYGVENDFLSH